MYYWESQNKSKKSLTAVKPHIQKCNFWKFDVHECWVCYQIKSVQWLQNVGCLKNRAINLWFLTSCTFFCRRAPFRANRLTMVESLICIRWSAIAPLFLRCVSPPLRDASTVRVQRRLSCYKRASLTYTDVSILRYASVTQYKGVQRHRVEENKNTPSLYCSKRDATKSKAAWLFSQ